MKVFSKHACGFRRNGGVLLKKGETVLEEPLTRSERLFVETMVKAKIARIISEPAPEAPVSETRLTTEEATSSRLDEEPKKPMRVRRRAAGK